MMKTKNLGMTIGSILIILLLMPLGHALMIIMEIPCSLLPCIILPLPWVSWDW